ncbi:MAG: hypothetical protein P1V36_16895 [Planctomycetota bacterium]|nr:hypothetical protein [Planctomycetota bacterium]
MPDATDILGNPLTEAEQKLLAAYRTLESLSGEELAPTAKAGVAEATACLWQVINNLGLTDDRPAC